MTSPKSKIYFDYAATTPVDPRVLKAMMPYFSKEFGNTASMHSFGIKPQEAVEKARKTIANALGAETEEIFFTASATESNNWALKGIALANKAKGNHIIISSVEHDCVLNSAEYLKSQGYQVSILSVDKYGMVNLDELKGLIRDETILVSIIHGNNEIGTIQPIEKIGKICKEAKVYFHTDASQSFTKVPINVKENNIDLLTASSHKIYGPKGAGILYIKKGTKIHPLLHGGGHETGMRSSTVNVPAIVGFGKAVELALTDDQKKMADTRDKIIKSILTSIPKSYLNGHPTERLSNNINVRFDFVEGESILMELDGQGIAVSSGSACSSASLEPSHVLMACGLKHEQAHGSIRISLGRFSTKQEVDYLIKVFPKVIEKLRKISPFK